MAKKPRWRKIRTAHHVLMPFWSILSMIDEIATVHTIVPGRVYTKSSSTVTPTLHLTTVTRSGPKYLMKHQSVVQELFIVCDSAVCDDVIDEIQRCAGQAKILYRSSL